MEFDFVVAGKNHRVSLEPHGGKYLATVDGRQIPIDSQCRSGQTISLLIGDRVLLAHLAEGEGRVFVAVGASRFTLEEPDMRQTAGARREGIGASAGGTIKAPMPGQVIKISVAAGDMVETGQGLVVVEAMKMEHEMRSPVDAVVEQVYVQVGQQVDAFQPLVELKPR